MITSLINNFKPIQIFLNYIFKKLLGDYILNELDISKMQVELENKQYFGLQDIELNTYGINLKHLINSPIKITNYKNLFLYSCKNGCKECMNCSASFSSSLIEIQKVIPSELALREV